MDALEDPLWYRVAGLQPRLLSHVRVQRRVSRGQVWYLLCDAGRRRYHRLDPVAWEFVGRLDGNATVDEIWQVVHQKLGEAAPSQSEVLQMLTQLATAELLLHHPQLDPADVVSHRRRREARRRASSVNPLFFKVPLFDPTKLLHRLVPLARVLFTPWAALAWMTLLLLAGVVAGSRWEELSHALTTHGRSAAFLLYIWLSYPFVKAVHEACHAMAVRVWGGEVREVGVSLMLLSPLPYVDASAATGFASKQRRMVVGAVGVMAELAIAAMALLLWSVTNTPTVQLVALAVVAGCGVSTLLFNANPLARFDGYHVLCDALDMPNLAQRANAVMAHAGRRLLGAAHGPLPAASPREAAGLALYGLLAWLYRVVVLVGVIWWLAPSYPLLAAALGVMGLMGVFGPALKNLATFLVFDPRLDGRRLRAYGLSVGVPVLALVALFAIPAPSFTVEQGVVWAPPEAIIRVDTAGDLTQLAARDQQRVEPDQLIAQLDNLALRGQREAAASRLQGLEVQYYEAMIAQSAEATRIAHERDSARATLVRLDERLNALTLRARTAGTLLVPRDSGQEGHHYRQGKELAYVLPDQAGLLVKVALSESGAALVRERTTRVSVLMPDGSQRIVAARLDRETPGVTRTLPSPALAQANGGPVPVDPADKEGRQALAPVTLVDVRVPDEATQWIGARTWVRFDHAHEPLGQQWTRRLEQSFLSTLALSPKS